MIREKAKEFLESYSKPYLELDSLTTFQRNGLKRKHQHSYAVASNCVSIATEFGMASHYIDIAFVIGLFHDIGRFEQLKTYSTFEDRLSIDHGNLSAKVAKESSFLKNNFSEYECELIYLSIKNHNKFKIDENITDERILLFCKLIRDADKIDIFRIYKQSSKEDFKDLLNDKTQKVFTKGLIDLFKQCKEADKKYRNTFADDVIFVISFLFDINFKRSFEIIKKDNLLDSFFDILNNMEEKVDAKNICNGYIEKKLEA